MKRFLPLFLTATLFVGCATTQGSGVAKKPSTTKIALQVEDNAVFGVGVKDELVGKFNQILLESKAGVPVVDASQADLIVRFQITGGNFTAATAWNWQLLDPDSGAIVLSEADTSAFGASGESLAESVVGKLASIDTTVYGQPNNGVVLAQQRSSEPAVATRASDTPGDNAWAVVIGIENYRESLPAATGAQADAQAFAEFAKNTLNVPESNIKVLLGDRATRADFNGALAEWLPRNAVKPGGKVYVFFSGHGAPDVETGSSYLVPYDGNPTYIKSSGISVAELQASLATMKSQQVFVFLDACFSGQGDRSVLPQGTRPIVPVKDISAEGEVVTFSASGASETTGAHEGGTHGLFTYHLLMALTGKADQNNDTSITTSEVAAYLVQAVPAEARRQNREQTPTATNAQGQVLVSGLR